MAGAVLLWGRFRDGFSTRMNIIKRHNRIWMRSFPVIDIPAIVKISLTSFLGVDFRQKGEIVSGRIIKDETREDLKRIFFLF